MKIDVPFGDVVDRVTILQLKEAHIADETAISHVRRELIALQAAWAAHNLPPMYQVTEWPDLCAVNAKLWDVEDALREHERRSDFGEAFVRLARSVYHLNDRRAALKRSINESLGSELIEQKSYADYATSDTELDQS